MNNTIKKGLAGAILATISAGLLLFPSTQSNNCGCDYGKCGCLQITLPPYNPFTPNATFPPLPFPTLQPSSTIIWVITKQPTHVFNATAPVNIASPTFAYPTLQPTKTLAPPIATLTKYPTASLPTYPPINATSTPLATVTPPATVTPAPTVTLYPTTIPFTQIPTNTPEATKAP